MRPDPAPRVLVVQHEDACPPALLGAGLEAAGCLLDVRRGHLGEAVPTAPGDADAVVVLGGAMGAHDDADHRWLGATKQLIRASRAADVPLLGICLGHQLIAVALGGDAAPNPRGRQSGVVPVGWSPAAADDPLLGAAWASAAVGVHFNDDVVHTLPAGATALAVAPGGEVQAARYGPRAWGVQCHPEADVAVFSGWPGTEPHVAAVADRAAELAAGWAPLARTLAALAHEHAGAR